MVAHIVIKGVCTVFLSLPQNPWSHLRALSCLVLSPLLPTVTPWVSGATEFRNKPQKALDVYQTLSLLEGGVGERDYGLAGSEGACQHSCAKANL